MKIANELKHQENDIKNVLNALIEKIEAPISRLREIEQFFGQFFRQLEQKVVHWKENIDHTLRLLLNIDPKHVLGRGYSIVRAKGKILKTTTGLAIGEHIETILSDGSFTATVTGTNKYGEQKRII